MGRCTFHDRDFISDVLSILTMIIIKKCFDALLSLFKIGIFKFRNLLSIASCWIGCDSPTTTTTSYYATRYSTRVVLLASSSGDEAFEAAVNLIINTCTHNTTMTMTKIQRFPTVIPAFISFAPLYLGVPITSCGAYITQYMRSFFRRERILPPSFESDWHQ